MIGVSGMGGTVGGTLTPPVAMRFAAAFAAFLLKNPPAAGRLKVVLGRDSRPSGPFVRDAVSAALLASGIDVIDLGVVPTPGVALMIRHLEADAGLVITASHNPKPWNGIKLLNRHAVAPPKGEVEQILAAYEDERANWVRIDDIGQPSVNTQTVAQHVKAVTDRLDMLGIASKRFKVVLDSVNGAGCVSGATLLSKLGCRYVQINDTPDGNFAHEPEPTEANLQQLCQEVRRQNADVGFAQDPDADRLAVVDEHGTYIGEEYTLALCAKHVLSKRMGAVAAANLSTSRMLDDIAKAAGARVVRTPVGEANVAQAMLREDAVIGGEGNGGVIDPRIVPGRDSLVAMAYVLQLMADTGKTLSELVAEIPKYVIIKDKFTCRREDADRAVAAVKSAFAGEKTDVQDGVRIDWPDSWVHARPSNTEPIMRIIAEAPTREAAQARIDAVRAVVDTAL